MKLFASLLTATLLVASVFSVQANEAVAPAAKPDLAKGEATYGAVCAACHGADGNSAISANAIMMGMSAALSEQDMKNIAAWLETKTAKKGFAKDKELVTLGERIYRGGIADRQIAACAGCHSPTGAGIPSQYPRLAGQHADYAVAQLTAFRDGVRKNNTQMTQVAAKLNDREIKAVSDYVAGLR